MVVLLLVMMLELWVLMLLGAPSTCMAMMSPQSAAVDQLTTKAPSNPSAQMICKTVSPHYLYAQAVESCKCDSGKDCAATMSKRW
jgi:hypothetical protein